MIRVIGIVLIVVYYKKENYHMKKIKLIIQVKLLIQLPVQIVVVLVYFLYLQNIILLVKILQDQIQDHHLL